MHNVTWRDVQIHIHYNKNKSSQEGESSLASTIIIVHIYRLFDHSSYTAHAIINFETFKTDLYLVAALTTHADNHTKALVLPFERIGVK